MLTETSKLDLRIPRDREGTFDPKLIARYQRPTSHVRVRHPIDRLEFGGDRLGPQVFAQSWRRNWEYVIPFFAFPVAVRLRHERHRILERQIATRRANEKAFSNR